MSQAIFHEHGATQDAITSVITGGVLARDSKDFVVVAGNRLSLYSIRSDSETSAHLKFITEIDVSGQIHSVDIARSTDTDTRDSVMVMSRHSVFSLLQFDDACGTFRTVNQGCFSRNSMEDFAIQRTPNTSFISTLLRVQNQIAVTRFNESALTFFNVASPDCTSNAYSICIKPTEKIQLVSVDDVQFVEVSQNGGVITVAILGKVHDDAWVGKPPGSAIPPPPSNSGCLRIVSIDMVKRSYSVLWSFEKLPSNSFKLISLSQGIVVVAPKSLTYCHEFSSSTSVEFTSDTWGNFRTGTDPFEIDLSHSHSTLVGNDLILFALNSGLIVSCHCIRKQLQSPIVVDYCFELSSRDKLPVSCLAMNGNFLFAGSAESDSRLFQVSWNQTSAPPTESSDTDNPLLAKYIRSISQESSTVSIDLGLVDELANSRGMISDIVAIDPMTSDQLVAQGPLGDGSSHPRLLTTNTAGKLHLTTCQIDVENLFETFVRHKFTMVENFSIEGKSILCLGTDKLALVIDSTNGLKEITRFTLTEDGENLLAFITCVDSVCIVTSNCVKNLTTLENVKTFSTPCDRVRIDGSVMTRLVDSLTIEVVSIDSWSVAEISHSVPITSFHPSVFRGQTFVVLTDSNGTLCIAKNGTVFFTARNASLCLPILRMDESSGEAADLAASASITDPTCRPIESNPSTSAFAQKVSFSDARLVWLSETGPYLVILIDGRPVLVYTPLDDKMTVWRLATIAANDLYDSSIPPLIVASEDSSITVRMNKFTTVCITADSYHGRIFVHSLGIDSGLVAVAKFDSEFIQDALVATHDDGRLCIWKRRHGAKQEVFCGLPTVEFDLQGESEQAVVGEKLCVSVAGVAVACMFRVNESTLEEMVIENSLDPEENMMDQPQQDLDAVGIGITHSTSTAPPPSTLKTNKRYIVKILSAIDLESVIACIRLQPYEHVTDMCWANTVVGLGQDVLVIGTTFGPGGISSIAQGRLVLVRVNYAPGTTQPAIDVDEFLTSPDSVRGGQIIFDSVKRSAVTVVKDWRHCIAIGLDQRLMFYQWDPAASRLRGCGMFDMSLQVSAMTFMKNYIVAGDVLRGVQFLRWKEDPVFDPATGMMKSMAASIQFLAKSSPYTEIFVKELETLKFDASASILSLDTYSNLDLSIFSPLHYGQYLRPCVPFQLPSKARATSYLGDRRCVVVAMNSGSLGFVVPVNEGDHHLASTLVGLMVTLLPMPGCVNPKLCHVAVGRDPTAIPGAVHAIEGISILRNFLFLSTPLQAEIASRMKQPIDVLTRHIQRWTRVDF